MTFNVYRAAIENGEHFSFEKLFAFPEGFAARDTTGRRLRVAIIGGGIAGLVAAYELRLRGHEVDVFEREQERVGGRIRTHRFSEHDYGELGAMRIPASHQCTLHYVSVCGLKLRPFVNSNPHAYYLLRGVRRRTYEWPSLAEQYLLKPIEQVPPGKLYEQVMMHAMMSLSTEDKWSVFATNTLTRRASELDEMSLWQYLKNFDLSPEAIEYIGSATGMKQYERASFLEALIDYFGLFRVDQHEIVGGMDLLPLALQRLAKATIHRGSEVSRVSLKDNGVELTWHGAEGPEHHKASFDAVICTIPAPALARIQFVPQLPARQAEAVRSISYASAAKSLVRCRRRTWESVDGIAGGGSFTDSIAQQCWYPSDNAERLGREVLAGFTADEVAPDAHSFAPRQWQPRSAEISAGGGVLTASYTWEANARKVGALSSVSRSDLVGGWLREIHPEVIDEVDAVEHLVWDQAESPGQGAFAFFAPGEHGRYQAVLGEPFPVERPRVFFAGEHLAVAHAWIQGAIQTALNAVTDVFCRFE